MLLGIGLAAPAHAGHIVTLTQVGVNVVATGSGSIVLAALRLFSPQVVSAQSVIGPNGGLITTGPVSQTPTTTYTGFAGPMTFGSGSDDLANSGSGDIVGIQGNPNPIGTRLLVPSGYSSGVSLADTSTYDNTTFSMLGVTPDTYVWTWGPGRPQTALHCKSDPQ